MQISFGGWMREVTGLDLMGGGPVQCDCSSHPTGPQLRRLSLDGWLFISLQSSPVPPPVNPDFAHAELGEKEVRFSQSILRLILPLAAAPISLSLSFLFLFSLFQTSTYPTSYDDIIRKKYLSTRSLVSNHQGLTREPVGQHRHLLKSEPAESGQAGPGRSYC